MNLLFSTILGSLAYLIGDTLHLAYTRPRRISHEAGHAVCAWFSPYVVQVERVTIVSNLITHEGYVSRQTIHVRGSLRTAFDNATIALGGLAGEQLAHGDYTPGNGRSDVEHATKGLRAVLPAHIVAPALKQAFTTATRTLTAHRQAFDRLCAALNTHETLEEPQLRAVLGPRR